MAFSDEIKKLQRTLRCHLRYSVGPGSDNPGVTAVTFDRRYGKEADNTGAIPVKGTVTRFGTFSRALTNGDQGFETPQITTELIDQSNEWRVLAARPWQLINRFLYYTLRVLQDGGAHLDSDVVWGQLSQPDFPPRSKVRFQVQMLPGDYLGIKVPRRSVSLDDWPNAHSSAVAKAVPSVYGKMDRNVGTITNFTGALTAPSGHVVPSLTGTLATGGSGTFLGIPLYYAICTTGAGGIADSPLSNVVGPFVPDVVNNAVQLTFTVPAPVPTGIRVFCGTDATFAAFDRYRDTGGVGSGVDLPGGTAGLLVTYPGINTQIQLSPDPKWDLNYRETAYYYLSFIVSGQEQPAVGPVGISLQPINRGGQAVVLTWDPVPGSPTSLVLRRAIQNHHFSPGYDREWSLSASDTTFTDFFSDTSAVVLPTGFGIVLGGAMELLYVDTNPAALAGEYKYLVAGHGCKRVRDVFVHKALVVGGVVGPVEPVLQTENVDYFVEAVTINGNRYQIVRFNPAQDGHIVTANVWGVETAGTATGIDDGGTLIENIVEQLLHFLYNWVFNSYASGSWFTTTGYKAGLLNDASFATAAAVAATRITGGYIGAGALIQATDVRQVLQDWLRTADLDWYEWNGQFKVKMFNPTVADRNLLTQYTPAEGVFRESFQPTLDMQRHWNRIIWQAGPQFDGYLLSGYEQDANSILDYERVIESPLRTYPWTRHSATVIDVVQRTLRLTKNPPGYGFFSTPLRALNDEMASLIAVTHPDGINVVATGWDRRVCKIVRSDLDLDRTIVNLTVLDVDGLLSQLGYVRYGNRAWAAADLVYTTATPAKQATYAYFADRNTGRFSNGVLAMKYG